MLISIPEPTFTGSRPLYRSAASSIASAASSTYRNSRVGLPVPHRPHCRALLRTAWTNMRIIGGMTCDVSGGCLAADPYRYRGIKYIAVKPYWVRDAADWTRSIVLAREYGALVSSG